MRAQASDRKRSVLGTVIRILVIIILIINLPPMYILVHVLDRDDCKYSTADSMFTYTENNFKGQDFNHGLRLFQAFKEQVRKKDAGYAGLDTTLYRVTKKEMYKIWLYGDYLFADKYRIPYKSWTEIIRN